MDSEYGELGRMTSTTRRSNEGCWNTTSPGGNAVTVARKYSFEYDVPNGISWTTTPDKVKTRVETDLLLGRVAKVLAYDGAVGPAAVFYEADYSYVIYRDLVESVTFGNGTKTEYEYYADDLVKSIRHWVVGGATPFLALDYAYDGRGLITYVQETDELGIVMTINYDYDARRRLIRETRAGGGPGEYDIAYTYDAGGNRLTKTDLLNAVVTTYHYDVDADADPTWTHRANRLMYSETRNAAFDLLERVEYEYALDGDAAGNVTQVIRGIPLTPAPNPVLFDFFATHFTYNKAGEVRIVTQRHWFSGATSAAVLKIREFRGSGRARHMMRDRDTAWPYAPDYTSAQWTDYNGDLPSTDYTVTDCATGTSLASVADDTHYSLGMAEIDYCTAGENCTEDTVSYTHTNHLGTTRARTNATSIPYERPVYTAFGERIDGDITSRYGYVGRLGYETMDGSDWGEWQGESLAFDFVHVGHRWYNPSTGRFLQRDPLGVNGGLNVYAYVRNLPTLGLDPKGLGFWDGNNAFHDWVARNFWRKYHSDSWIESPGATVEAVAISCVAAPIIYYVGKRIVTKVRRPPPRGPMRHIRYRPGMRPGQGFPSSRDGFFEETWHLAFP